MAPLQIVLPQFVAIAAVAGIALSLLYLMVTLLGGGGRAAEPTLDEHMASYGPKRKLPSRRQEAPKMSLGEQARDAAKLVLANNHSLEAKIASRLEGAGMSLHPSEWILIHAGIVVVMTALGLLLSAGNPLAMVLFAGFGTVGPWFYLGFKRNRRLKAFDGGLADSLQLMAGSLSAGLSLAQSLDTVVREGGEPISGEYRRAIVEARLGVELEDALEGVATRMQSKDFAWVVMAIRIQREVGGNLAELLLTVAATLREREYLRRHVRALSAEGRLSCWVLGGLPPVFLAYLAVTKGDYVKPMFTTPIGWLLCAAMAVLLSVGVFWMSKVSKVEL